LRAISLGWPWTVVLLISASWVASITVMSHQCPVYFKKQKQKTPQCLGFRHSFKSTTNI
jgi:hypothetical protein